MSRSHFQILLFLAAILVLGAVLAPALYWGGKWLAGLVVSFKQTETPVLGWIGHKLAAHQFDSYYNRAFLIAALGLLWPFLKWMRLSGDSLGLEPNPRRWRDSLQGFVLTAGTLALLTAGLVGLGAYIMEERIKWGNLLPRAILSAVVVALLEEWLFRRVFLGVALRASRPWVAMVLVSGLFSILHLMKAPDVITRQPHDREAALRVLRGSDWGFHTDAVRLRPGSADLMIDRDYKEFSPSRIHAGSGFAMTAAIFRRNLEPGRFCAEFLTLFAIGLMLARARCATRSLALPIGMHAGWIFANVLCSGATMASPALLGGEFDLEMAGARLPLIGDQLKIGLLPLATLVLTAIILEAGLSQRRPTKTPTAASS
jgi:membrane protease YdiL (CAAX protease family)